MFSGIVEEAGRIAAIRRSVDGIRLVVEGRTVGQDVKPGESVAVNGCCLTVVNVARARSGRRLHFDLLEETWRMTSFADLIEGRLVNLERSLKVDDRIGGHFVTGHVDGTGRITRWERIGADWVLEVEPPPKLMRYFLYKGSVAIDGISLTVADVWPRGIRCWIIPHTWEATNLREGRVGGRVNLEADLLGKYVERLIEARDPGAGHRRLPSNRARSRVRASRGSRSSGPARP